ncbi:MAG: hypothetical protein ACLTXH_00620 [Enterobacter hormaechei]
MALPLTRPGKITFFFSPTLSHRERALLKTVTDVTVLRLPYSAISATDAAEASALPFGIRSLRFDVLQQNAAGYFSSCSVASTLPFSLFVDGIMVSASLVSGLDTLS